MRPEITSISLFAAVIALAFAGFPSPASACEGGRCVTSTHPSEGETDVPVDAAIWVFYETGGGAGLSAVLRGPDGEPVVVNTHTELGGEVAILGSAVLVLAPQAPLAPDTTYELELLDSPQAPDLCAGPSTVVFTTGREATTPVSSHAGDTWADGTFLDEEGMALGSNCDVGPERWRLEVGFTEPNPSSSAVAWRLYSRGELVATSPTVPLRIDLPELEQEGVSFTIRAVNGAGVEGKPSRATVWPVPLGPDGEAEDEDDDFVCAFDGPRCCSFTDSALGSDSLWSMLVLLGFAGLGRRRSGQASPMS
jgi:hypothetical protein